jgi:hypothetical protein
MLQHIKMSVSLSPYMFRSRYWPSSGAQRSSHSYLPAICCIFAQPYPGLWPALCLRCRSYLATARLDVYWIVFPTADSDINKFQYMWRVANPELHCLIPQSTYLISTILTSRMKLSFVQKNFYGPFHSTVKTFEQNWCHQTYVNFCCDLYYITLLQMKKCEAKEVGALIEHLLLIKACQRGKAKMGLCVSLHFSLVSGSSYLFYLLAQRKVQLCYDISGVCHVLCGNRET